MDLTATDCNIDEEYVSRLVEEILKNSKQYLEQYNKSEQESNMATITPLSTQLCNVGNNLVAPFSNKNMTLICF